MTHSVYEFSVDPFLLWTHTERDQVSVLTLFARVTFLWPFLVKTQPGRNTPNIKGLPAPASLLYVYLHGHPGICINRFNAWKKFHNLCWNFEERNCTGSASHLGMIKHWQGESDEAVAIIRTMTSTNCNHCRDEAHNQKLLESARKMSSQSGATWGGESFSLWICHFHFEKTSLSK